VYFSKFFSVPVIRLAGAVVVGDTIANTVYRAAQYVDKQYR